MVDKKKNPSIVKYCRLIGLLGNVVKVVQFDSIRFGSVLKNVTKVVDKYIMSSAIKRKRRKVEERKKRNGKFREVYMDY